MVTTPRSRVLSILALTLLFLAALPTAAAPLQAGDKIEGALLDRLTLDGQADFVVVMAKQADLSAAYTIADWNARGQYVYDTLRAVASESQAEAQDYLAKRGIAFRSFFAGNELYVYAGDLQAAQTLAALDDVALVRAARTYYLDPILSQGTPAPAATTDWGIIDTKANQFWTQFGVQGEGIVVANIDTGVQWNHPALDQAYKCAANPTDPACWLDPANICGGNVCDNNGHGTHTMGTMVGDDDPSLTYIVGMAPGAQFIMCKGCESSSCSETSLNACADWIVAPGGSAANRPHVVNNSWGGSGGNAWYLGKVNAWRAAGIFPAFSAGNSGSSCSTLGSPGDYQESFGSAAHDSSRVIASFSSRGPSAYGHEPYTKPNISAPGVDICSSVPTNGWNCTYDGTSMASPHTAGAVALLWSCNASLVGQIDQTFQILQDYADAAPAGNCGAPPDGEGNYTYGYGYLNVLAAGLQNCVAAWGALHGHVRNAQNAAPIAGATVTAQRQGGGAWNANTDSSGYYTVTVGAGTYTVTVTHPYFTAGTAYNVVVVTDTVVTRDFDLQPRGRLFGYVSDANSGAPLNATVTADGTSASTNPATGFYEMYLDAGTYDVTAEATDYASQTVSIDIPVGGNVQQDFALLAAVAVVPDPIHATVELGQGGSVTGVMTNNMGVDYPFEFVELPGGLATLGSGGPDPFGYTYKDSNEPGGARYEWIDATDGTPLNLADDGEATVAIPFPFTFYDQTSTNLCVGNNGGALFNPDTCDLPVTNANLETTTYNNLIVPFWDDMDSDTGNVYYKTIGTAPHRIFVVEWYNRPHYSNIGSATFELMLYEGTNNIKYQYLDTNFGNVSYDYGVSATSGIRRQSPNYLQYSYNQPVLVDNLAICFQFPGSPPCDGGDIPWFGTSITAGTVPAGNSLAWTNAFTATPAAGVDQPGQYRGSLLIHPTSGGGPTKYIAVILDVLPTASMGLLEGTVTSDRPGGPLEATVLITDSGGFSVTLTTDPATGYYSYWLEAGAYAVTASADDYVPQTAAVQVIAQQTTVQDFELALNEPEIVVSPAALVETLQFGQTSVQVLHITNDGLQPLTWEIREANAGQAQANDILLMGDDLTSGSWTVYRDSLTAAGVSWDEWNLDSQPFPNLAQLAPYSLLIWADESVLDPGDTQCQIVADWLNSGGKSLFATSVDFLWDLANGTPGAGEHNLYLLFQTTYQGDYAGTGITALNGVAGDPIGGDFVAPNGLTLAGASSSNGDYANIASSAATTGLIYGPGGTGSGYAGLTHYEGANYKTVWLGVNFHNGLTVPAQRNELISNILTFLGGGGDVPWLSESPISGTVLPGETADVDVTFDTTQVPEPGVYQAVLRVLSNDPLDDRVDVPVTLNVLPSGDMGKLEGTVTSDRPGGPLDADVLIETSYGVSWTVPTNPATGYYYKWLVADTYTVTASAAGYIPSTAVVQITGLQTTTQDFQLALLAPEIAVDPTTMEQTLEMGGVGVQTLNISNLGNLPLTFEIVERNGGFTPGLAGEDILVVRKDATAAAAMEAALTALGYTFLGVTDAQFQAMTVDQLLEYLAVFYAGTTGYTGAPTASELLLVAYLDAGGSLYISDNDLGYYRHGSAFYDTYLQSTYVVDNGGDYLDGLDIMAGLTLDVSVDPFPDGIAVGAEGTPIFQFQGSSNYGGAALDRSGYRAVYTAFDFQYIADPAQEVEVVNRVLGFIAVSDAPWLSEDPITGTVAPGDAAPVAVTFDAGVAAEPGTYTAQLRIKHNDPLAQTVNVPVTLTVEPSASYGRLEGVVSGLGYCDAAPTPLEAEVLIVAEDGSSWTVTSDPGTGYYFRWLLGGVYTVTAGAAGHLPATGIVTVVAQQTSTLDLGLRYVESCMDITPLTYSLTLPVDTVFADTLTILNAGAGELAWQLAETTATLSLAGQFYAPAARYDPALAAEVVGVPAAPAPAPAGPVPTFVYPESVLYDNGPLVTHPGSGFGGADASALQTTLGMDTYGFGHQFANGYRMADDFTITDPAGWQIDSITFFAYQTNSPTSPSPITGVYYQIWDGPPDDPNSSVVFGDLTTNRLLSSTFSNIYRVLDTGLTDTARAVFADKANAGVTLPPGTYWLDWMTDGSTSYTGPWAPPISILGQTTTGNALQYTGSWAPALDTGTSTQQGMPFIIEGMVLFTDVPWVSEAPTSGLVLPDDAFVVDVVFDTTGLTVGECYNASLVLLHDDPGWEDPLYLPLELCVVELVTPTASFESNSPVCLGEPLVLTNTTLFADSYLWTFGDGITSTLKNPTHIYAQPGSYEVTLEACNNAGCGTATKTVAVLPPPTADFNYTVAGLTVTFANASANAGAYLWEFGDTFTSTLENPVHTYAAAGTYVVTLWAMGDCGTAGISKTLVLAGCDAVQILDLTTSISGCVVTFGAELNGTEPFAYLWDFGTFGTSTDPAPVVDFLATGTYTVTLDVNNCDGAGHDTRTETVEVSCVVPPAPYTIYLPLIVKTAAP